MSNRSEFMINMELRIKFFELLIIKLSSIFNDYYLRQIETIDNQLLYKIWGHFIVYLTHSHLNVAGHVMAPSPGAERNKRVNSALVPYRTRTGRCSLSSAIAAPRRNFLAARLWPMPEPACLCHDLELFVASDARAFAVPACLSCPVSSGQSWMLS